MHLAVLYRFVRKPLVLASLAVMIAGCSQFPEIDESFSPEARNEPFPLLVPTEVLRADAPVDRIDDQSQRNLESRGDALRNRARQFRSSVLDQSARTRLEDTPELPSED